MVCIELCASFSVNLKLFYSIHFIISIFFKSKEDTRGFHLCEHFGEGAQRTNHMNLQHGEPKRTRQWAKRMGAFWGEPVSSWTWGGFAWFLLEMFQLTLSSKSERDCRPGGEQTRAKIRGFVLGTTKVSGDSAAHQPFENLVFSIVPTAGLTHLE